LLGRSGAFADDDVAAFQGSLDADGPEAQQMASRQACAVPLGTARGCSEALAIAEAAWPAVVEPVRCEVRAAALPSCAAIDAVLLNVEADLAGLVDPDSEEELSEICRKLQAEAHARLERMSLYDH